MSANQDKRDPRPASVEVARGRRGPLRLASRTLLGAWEHNIFSEAASAAFWQTLSLPPLLLGLLGSLGYVADWFGPDTVNLVQHKLIAAAGTVFAPSVVDQIIAPTVADVLTKGRGEIVSIGFILSWWAGSSALAAFVDAITRAYGQYGVRHPAWQRIVALLMYLVALICAVIGLPLLALGPGLLPELFPVTLRPTVVSLVGVFYYPATAGLLVVALATLYKVALPRKLPWWRGLPGALLAMVVALGSSSGLRLYIRIVLSTGYTYGALATPIAFLLGAFLIGLAVILGAHFNSAIQEMWPARTGRRERRKWRRLEPEAEPAEDTVTDDTGGKLEHQATLETSETPVRPGTDHDRPSAEPEPPKTDRDTRPQVKRPRTAAGPSRDEPAEARSDSGRAR